MQWLFALLVPVRIAGLTVAAHEHDWGCVQGPNYTGWWCRGCNEIVWGNGDAPTHLTKGSE